MAFSQNHLTKAPSAGSGRKSFKSEHEMVVGFIEQKESSGRYRQSRMSWEGESFISYWTTIARWIGKGKTRCVVVDESSFGSSYTPGHRRVVENALKRVGAKVFHVNYGARGQNLRVSPTELRDHHVAEFTEKDAPERTFFRHPDGSGEWKSKRLHKKTLAQRFLHKFQHLDKALEVCDWFKLPKVSIERMQIDAIPRVIGCLDILIANTPRGWRLNWWTERELPALEKGRSEALAKRDAAIADAAARVERGDGGWFGKKDWLLDGRPDLLHRALATRHREQSLRLRRLAKERALKIREAKENESAAAALLDVATIRSRELEAMMKRCSAPKTGDRAIVLE